MKTIRTSLCLVVLLLFGACTMEQIETQWDAWVDDHDECEVDEDCVLVYPSCPLGCYAAINREHEDEAGRLADDLVNRWSMGVQDCAYDCIGATAECVENACEAIPDEEF